MISPAQLQDALRTYVTRPSSVEVGPFVVTLDPGGQPGRNYAIPLADAVPTGAEVEALRAFFADRDLLPRLEVVLPSTALDALLAGGFTIRQRLPLMVLGTLVEPPPVPGLEVRLATTDDDLATAARVQDLSYGDTIDPDNPGRLRRTVDVGGHVALALVDGEPVGSGLATEPLPAGTTSVSQLAAVGTLSSHRRRGVAAHVATRLAQALLAAGTTPYLEAEAPEVSLYARLGFEPVGEMGEITG